MLVECGFVRAQASDGSEWTFTPSFSRIADLGPPHEIVRLYCDLHDPARAAATATYVLACLCDQEDPLPLIGGWEIDPQNPEADPLVIPAAMPVAEQIIVARHLMQHGIAGKCKPNSPSAPPGKFSDQFKAAEYVAAARVHLGLSSADAGGLSMTEFQDMLAMKYPDAQQIERDVPSRTEYEAAMRRIMERKRG